MVPLVFTITIKIWVQGPLKEWPFYLINSSHQSYCTVFWHPDARMLSCLSVTEILKLFASLRSSLIPWKQSYDPGDSKGRSCADLLVPLRSTTANRHLFFLPLVLQQLPMRLFLSAVGIHRAPLCFSVWLICLLSVPDKEYFMEMHPYSRHLNGVRWSGVRADEVVVCHWYKM